MELGTTSEVAAPVTAIETKTGYSTLTLGLAIGGAAVVGATVGFFAGRWVYKPAEVAAPKAEAAPGL